MAGKGQLRVLVVRVGAMGDVLHGLPAVCALRERVPDASIGWVVDPRWAPLLAGSGPGVVDRVHPAEVSLWKRRPVSGTTVRSILRLRRELRAERYDVCVDLQGTMRSALIGRMSGTRRLVGPAAPREAAAAWMYGERLELRARSVVRQACELMSEAAGTRLAPAAVRIPRDEAAESWCANEVGGPAACLLAPGGGGGATRWPAERFVEVGRALREAGERVLVNAAAEHDEASREIAERCGGERVVCDVAGLIALTRRARLVVGGDTGPVHLAAALGRPTVALFGPTDPERNGPDFPGARVRVLRHGTSVTTYKRTAECEAGLSAIGVDEVLRAAGELLREGADG